MDENEIILCDECGSKYFKVSSKMKKLCLECAHILYGYPKCNHMFKKGRCIYCYWDGKQSGYIEGIEKC